jgi:hypothetical protein
MHTQDVLRSFVVSSCEGSESSFVIHDQLEVCLLSQRNDVAIPIRSITERPSLFPASHARYLNSAPCGDACSPGERDVGFILFLLNDTNDLAPASYTGSHIVRVLQVSGGSNRLHAFWLEPVSVFGSAGFNGALSSSRVLDISFSLTLPPP